MSASLGDDYPVPHSGHWEKDSGDIQETEGIPLGDKCFLRNQPCMLSQFVFVLSYFLHSPIALQYVRERKSKWLTEMHHYKRGKRDQSRSGSRKNLSKWAKFTSRNSSEIPNKGVISMLYS